MEFNCREEVRGLFGSRAPAVARQLKFPPNWEPKWENIGIELVTETPERSGPVLEENLRDLLAWVNTTPGITGEVNCGVHVHLGALPTDRPGYLPPNYASFLVRNERFFLYLVPRWRALGYNYPWLASTVRVLKKEIPEGQSRVGLPNWIYPTSGYSTAGWYSEECGLGARRRSKQEIQSKVRGNRLWFHGFSGHNTIEYRLLHGNRDIYTTLGWVAFLNFVHGKSARDELPGKALFLQKDSPATVFSKTMSFLKPTKPIKLWLETQYAAHDISNRSTTATRDL